MRRHREGGGDLRGHAVVGVQAAAEGSHRLVQLVVLPLGQVHLGGDVAVAPEEEEMVSGERGGRRRVVLVRGGAWLRAAVAHDRILIQIDLHHLVGDQVLPLGQREHLLVDPH